MNSLTYLIVQLHLLNPYFVVDVNLIAICTCIHRIVHWANGLFDVTDVPEILRYTGIYLPNSRPDDNSVHALYLLTNVRELVGRIVDEHGSHDGQEVARILVIDGDAGIFLELFANGPLGQIEVELRKIQGVQGRLGLLKGFQHLGVQQTRLHFYCISTKKKYRLVYKNESVNVRFR